MRVGRDDCMYLTGTITSLVGDRPGVDGLIKKCPSDE